MKSVLIITYYWPPAGGPGVQRALKFAKYLPAFGWRPIILTVENGEYPAIDETLFRDISASLVVRKTSSLEPYALYRALTGKKSTDKITTFVLTENSRGPGKKLASFIRANLFIPDARIGWKPFAVNEGRRLIKEEKIDLIFSTAPPMSAHLIARALAKKSALPWIADFRDPWTDIFYYHRLKRSGMAVTRDRQLEKSVLRSANGIITVSSTLAKLLESKALNVYYVIPNGFDEDDFHGIAPLPDDGKFHIVHAGHLASNQNPAGLWRTLKKIVDGPFLKGKLQLDFYGAIHEEVHRSLAEHGLEHHAVFFDYIPHDQLVAVMKRAALLFFVVPDTSYAKGILTSKLFDYMGAGRPILGIGPEDGDAAKILRQTRIGRMINDADHEQMRSFLIQLQEQEIFLQNNDTKPFTRARLTKALADIFHSLD
ncbi:glycosyltransferase family 4 protein [candidate division KSB1 bacterium]|nr:glycosyltransferase family 4 protein [candidate division KSB1 bacterium]